MNRFTRLFLSSLAVSILASFAMPAIARAEPHTVTFSEPAMRVPALLEKLSAQTGTPISATQDFKNEVVLVHVKDVALEELLAQIARVTSGVWHQSADGSMRLVADTSTRRKEREDFIRLMEVTWELDQKAQHDAREKTMKETLEREQSEGFLSLPEEQRRRHMLSVRRMWQRYWWGNSVPREIALEAMLGTRVVLSSSPNSLQRQMPESTRELLADMAESLAEQADLEPETTQFSPSARADLRSLAQNLRSGAGPALPRALLILQPGASIADPLFGTQVTVNAIFLDRNNRLLSFESFSALGSWGRSLASDLTSEPPAETEEPIAISERSATALEVLAGSSLTQPRAEPLDPEFVDQMKDVVANEPHGYQNSDALIGYAKRQEKNLVAGIPDTFWLWAETAGTPSVHVGYLEREMDRVFESNRGEGSWLVLKPRIADILRPLRTDRDNLKQLLLALDPLNSVPISQLAEYAANNPEPRFPLFVSRWITGFGGMPFGQQFNPGGYWPQLRFLGNLSIVTRSRILKGESVSFRELELQDRQALIELLVSGRTPLSATDPEAMSRRRDLVELRYQASAGNPLAIGRIEPTELLGYGLNPDGRIDVRIERHSAFALQDSRGELAPYEPVLNAESYGMSLVHQEEVPQASTQRFDHFRLGTERRLLLSIRPIEDVEAFLVFSEFTIPADSQPMHITKLPEEFRKLAQEMVERGRKARWWERLPGRGPQP